MCVFVMIDVRPKLPLKKPVLLFKLKFDHKALVLNDQAFASFNGPLESEMDKVCKMQKFMF